MVAKLPCKLCNETVAKKHHAVQCDNCHLRVNIRCNKINLQTYKFLQKSSFAWYCIKCFEDIIPFSTISNKSLSETNLRKKEKFKVLTKKVLSRNDDSTAKITNPMKWHLFLNFSDKRLSLFHLKIFDFLFTLKNFQQFIQNTTWILTF